MPDDAESTLLTRALRLPTRRPLSTLAALALLAVLGGVGSWLRGVDTQFGVEQFVPQGDLLFQRYETLNAEFGRDDNTVFVFGTRDDWFTRDGLETALAISDALAASEMVKQVVGGARATLIQAVGEDALYVGDILTKDRVRDLDAAGRAQLKAHLTGEAAYAGRVISRDARTLAFAVRIDDAYYGGAFHPPIVKHVEAALQSFRGKVDFIVTGAPPTQEAYRRFLRDDARLFVLLTGLLLGVALAVTLRTLQGVILPLLAIAAALYFTGVFLAISGRPVNMLTSAIPVLVLIVGVSDAIHLLTRYGEELAGGLEQRKALERSVEVTAHACLLTSVTTSAGFFVLPATGIPVLADMGLVTGAGVLIAYLTTLTLVPALAVLMAAPRPLPPAGEAALLSRVGAAAMNRPALTVVGLALLLAALVATGAPGLRVESRVIDDLPADHPVVRTREQVDLRMGGNYPLTFLIHPRSTGDPTDDPELLARVAAFQERLSGLMDPPYVAGSLSAADYLGLGSRQLGGPRLPTSEAGLAQVKLFIGDETLAETRDREGRFLRVQLRVYDRGTQATFRFLELAQAAFVETFADTAQLEVQGFTFLAHRTHRNIVTSAMTSFTLDFVIVAVLVCSLFRSLRLTLLAIIPNVFPLVCTVAFMGLAGIDLRISSAIVFSIVFGIAVDDTVHFLARYHEEQRGGLAPREAAEKTIATTGRAMAFMAFVLACGFGVLLLSAFSPNRVLGLLMAVTVASGVVGDLILLPSLLVIGERRPAESH